MENNSEIEFNVFLERFKKSVSKIGLKNSIQKDYILKTLYFSTEHLTAEEISNKIKQNYNVSIGIATVYRALSFLEEVDLITSITFGTDGKKYESNAKSHHDHLICTTCGKIIEFIDDEIEKRQDKIAKKNKFRITSHSMQLYGTCENCQEL